MPEVTAEDFEETEAIDLLRAANRRLAAQVSKLKAGKEELVAAVHQAAADAASGLSLPRVPKPAAGRRSTKTAETAVAVLSDWQLGKTTPTYSSEICETRIQEYAQRVIRLAENQRADHPVTDLRVYLLGDLVEGELIFPGQSHLIDSSLFTQVMSDGPRILGGFLRTMLTAFQSVHVVGVIGNHGSLGGRARKDYHPETNADAMMYETTRLILQDEDRLTWAANMTPGERHWYAVDAVGEKAFFLFHGDQVKGGFAGFPWYGFSKKVMGWSMNPEIPDFDYALSGHFHTPVRMLIGGKTLWGSGSTESTNTYAAELLAAHGTPNQWLLFCHPEHGVTAEYQVHLK